MRPPVKPVPWLYQGLWQAQSAGGQGYTLQVYKMAPCPCGRTPASPPDMSCQACGGTGLLYPVPAQTVQALVSQVDLSTELVAMGLAQPGDLQVSTQPGQLHLDPFDLCFIGWDIGMPVSGEVVARGPGSADALQYRAALVEGIWTVDPVTGQHTPYQRGTDFQVQGRTVTWLAGGTAPAPGTLYTIRYSGDFEWIVYQPPDQRVAFGVDLGQRAVLRKRYLVLPNAPAATLLES